MQVSFFADARRRDPEQLLRAWPTLLGVAAGAARAGLEVIVVQAAHRRQSLQSDGVSFHFVDDERAAPLRLFGSVRIPRRPSRLIDQVAALAPDVVHVHGLLYPFAVRQLAKAIPSTPVVVQDHATAAPSGWRRHAWRWTSRSLSGVVFTTREQAKPFFETRTLRAALPVFEVVEGSSTFRPGDREAARSDTGMFGAPCLLWTGRLNRNKDPLTALAALELAIPRLPDARLWCCFGDAPLLDVVQRRIAGSALLRQRVTLVGQRPHAEMELRFRAADFFVQTSHSEGSSYSALESLACGTPPLVTDIPSMRRIVGDAGSLTPVGDAAGLADAMVEWAGRDATKIRDAARARFERELTYDAIGRELRVVYETLAGRS